MFEAALYVGGLSLEVADRHRAGVERVGVSGTSSFILGGQIAGERPEIFLVYPEGNYIRASDERPFLQIGETKFGKLMLDLATEARVDLNGAVKIAVSSMISTARANLSVGPPYDLGVYRNGTLSLEEARIEADSDLLESIQRTWLAHLLAGLGDLPDIDLAALDD